MLVLVGIIWITIYSILSFKVGKIAEIFKDAIFWFCLIEDIMIQIFIMQFEMLFFTRIISPYEIFLKRNLCINLKTSLIGASMIFLSSTCKTTCHDFEGIWKICKRKINIVFDIIVLCFLCLAARLLQMSIFYQICHSCKICIAKYQSGGLNL